MTEPFNAAAYLTERRVAAGDGDRVAVRHPRGTLTYAELAAEVRRVAAGLTAVGVRPEERVVLCMVDDVELFTGILAAMYIGAVAVPCSTMLTGPELAQLVVDSRARVVLGSQEFAATITTAAADAPDLRHVVLTGDAPAVTVPGVGSLTWRELLAAGAQEPVERPYADLGRVPRPLALHLRHDRHAEGGDAPPHRHPLRRRDLWHAGARRRPRRHLPVGREAVLRLRHRQLDVLPPRRRRHRGAGALAAQPDALRRPRPRARRDPLLRRAELLGSR